MGDALPLVNVCASCHAHVEQGDGGNHHTCVLLNDTAVKCFGYGLGGRLGYGDTDDRGNDPGEMGDLLPAVDVLGSATGVRVVRVWGGGDHSCALISDGSMKCWGSGADGRLGQESTADIGDGAGEMGDSLPVIQLGGSATYGVLSASLGSSHTCVRLNDSSVKCFGDNGYGQLGQGDAIKRGDNAGEMGSALPVVDIGPATTSVPTPAPTPTPTPVPTVSAAPTARPTLPQLAPVIQVIALYETTCSIQAPPASDLRCWGHNNYGQLGQGDTTTRGNSPWDMGANLSAVDLGTSLTPRPNVSTISMAGHSCNVLDPDGSVKCFGRNNNGQLGYGDTDDRGDNTGELGDALPAVDLGLSLPPILQLAQGGLHNCVLFTQNSRVKCWGYGFNGQLGYEDTDNRGDGAGEMGDSLPFVDLGTDLGAHELYVGESHTCARLNDTRQGGLKCWGSNFYGQLGYGDTNYRGDGASEMGDALPLVSLTSSGHVHVVQGDGGSVHTCVLLNDSAVKCFGDGNFGRLGYGDTADRGDDPGEMGDSLPAVDVLGSATGVHVARVLCGTYHSCALISDGSLKCWGDGSTGQLGQENTDNVSDGAGEMGDSLPVIQLGDQSVVSASLGFRHTCVRLNDSSVKCFGYNFYGQLGQGDTNNRGDGVAEMGAALPVVDIGPVVTGSPTPAPTPAPSALPTLEPTPVPSSPPTLAPTDVPTAAPTSSPSAAPSVNPSTAPSAFPSSHPTPAPSSAPSSAPSMNPSTAPTDAPTAAPSSAPTSAPSANPSVAPTDVPTAAPTGAPSSAPSANPSAAPSTTPSAAPTSHPTFAPTNAPAVSPAPTTPPTPMPSPGPTMDPSPAPTSGPSVLPSAVPSLPPTPVPSSAPSALPSAGPSNAPSTTPSSAPTAVPSPAPSPAPSTVPSAAPTSAPSPLPSAGPTAQPSMGPTPLTAAPTLSLSSLLALHRVPQLTVTDVQADAVTLSWPRVDLPSLSHVVVGYRVAVQTAGEGAFATVAEPSHNWTTVRALSPATLYRFKVAVVAAEGIGALSDRAANATTRNVSAGRFEDTGVAVRIVSSTSLPSCDAAAILDASEDVSALFGAADPNCTVLDKRTARLQLEHGATLAPGTEVRVWTNETVAFSAPANPTPIVPSLGAASHVSWCGSWTADASSSTGVGSSVYPLSYSWWVSSLDAGNAAAVTAENTRLSVLTTTASRVLFNATDFAQGSVVTVHVNISSAVFNLSATTKTDTNISALEQPTLAIAGSANRSVVSFKDLTIRATASATTCFNVSLHSARFRWVAVQGQMPTAATTNSRTLFIPALSLDVLQTYTFRVRMTLDDFPMLPTVTADVQVSTTRVIPPVVAITGGTKRTVGCEANTSLDASQSYDPNVCGVLQSSCTALRYTWSCIGCDSFPDGASSAAVLQVTPCDLLDAAPASDTVLQFDLAVFSLATGLIATGGVQLAVLPPHMPPPPSLVVDPLPDSTIPGEPVHLCSGQANASAEIVASGATETSVTGATGSYFILSTSALQFAVQYALVMRDLASGAVASTAVALNDPPSLGSFVVSPNTAAGGEAVLDAFELHSWGHIDDPAHMPLFTTFWWRDDSGYEAVLAESTAEFSLAEVALPAGSSVTARVQVADRLGSSSSLAASLVGELAVTVSSLPTSVDWNRPGAISSALRSWFAFSAEMLFAILYGGELLSFEQLALMTDLSPSTAQAERLLALAPAAFAAIPADELSQSSCTDAQAITTLPGVNAIDALLFLAQIADSGCGNSVFVASATASEQYLSLADLSSTRFGLAEDTDVSTSNGVTLQIDAAVTSTLAVDAEFVDTRTSTVSETAAFATANTQVLSAVHNLELRPSSLPCSDLCNHWEAQTNGRCTAQDLPADTAALGENAVTIRINVDENALDLDPVVDKCGKEVEPEVKCMHAQWSDLVDAAGNDSANVTWSTEGCELVERTKDSVTCACSHLTAFAVGAIVNPGEGECGETQCEELGEAWGEIYDSPGYATWLAVLCCAWVFILVTDAQWFYDPETARQRSKFTELVFIGYTTIVLAVLRILYYMLMLIAYGTAENGMACAEFGMQGSGSAVPPYALFAVHDIFYPVFLALFASVFLYWIDLAEVIEVNMGKAQNMLFLMPETWHEVILFNACLLVYSAILDTYLVVEGNASSGTSAAARGHLAFMAAVFLAEAALFVYGRDLLDKQSQDKSTMKKINMMSKVLCGMFAGLALLLLMLAATPAVQHAESAFTLYSFLLPVNELVMVRFLYSTMHEKKGQMRKLNEALVERGGLMTPLSPQRVWNLLRGRAATSSSTASATASASAAAAAAATGSAADRASSKATRSRGAAPAKVGGTQAGTGATSTAAAAPAAPATAEGGATGQTMSGMDVVAGHQQSKKGKAQRGGIDLGDVYGGDTSSDTLSASNGAIELAAFRRATHSKSKLGTAAAAVRAIDTNPGSSSVLHGSTRRAPFQAKDQFGEPLSPRSPVSPLSAMSGHHTSNALIASAHSNGDDDQGAAAGAGGGDGGAHPMPDSGSPRSAARVAPLEGSTARMARRQSAGSVVSAASVVSNSEGSGDQDDEEEPASPSVHNPLAGLSRARRRGSSAGLHR